MSNKSFTKIGIFYGSDTDNTERIANMICEELSPFELVCKNIDDSSVDEFMDYESLLFGVWTLNVGEIQCSFGGLDRRHQHKAFLGKTSRAVWLGRPRWITRYVC